LWVHEATQLIYSGIAAHFTFRDSAPRLGTILDHPANLRGLRHWVMQRCADNFGLIPEAKRKWMLMKFTKTKAIDNGLSSTFETNYITNECVHLDETPT
jgi:hypothetical protein